MWFDFRQQILSRGYEALERNLKLLKKPCHVHLEEL